MLDNSNRLWVIHIGNNAAVAERARKENFICIGWTKIGDLTPFNTRDKMRAALRKAYPSASDATVRASYGQPFRFAHEMKIGEVLVYPVKGSRELMIGEIEGPYRWASDDRELRENDYCNVRGVKWLKSVPRIAFSSSALHSFGSFTSVSSSDEFIDEVRAILKGQDIADEDVAAEPPLKVTASTDPSSHDRVNLAEQAVQETEDFLIRQWTRTSQDFEKVVAAVFRAMGYTAETQQGVHDLGVDVLAHPDPLGVQPPLLKIQAKSGATSIGAPAVKQLRGLLNEGEKGVLIALGGFTNDARHVQQNNADLHLIDGSRFVDLFLQFYDRLEPEVRHQFPLKRVYVPAE